MPDYGLSDKTVLITGTNNGQGIGASCALAFAREGAKVALLYKKLQYPFDRKKIDTDGFDRYYKALSDDCAALEKRLQELGADYLILESDIRDEKKVAAAFDQIEARYGTVRILINNAAVCAERDTIFSLATADMHMTYDTNIKGTLLMIREYVKRFGSVSSSGGRIINISTDAAQVFAGGITYGSSKAAIEALTRAIGIELGGLGITVNTVAPGPTQTGWINEQLAASVLPQIPLGRLGTPQDIADTILFLASDQAAWLTGQVIKVSGGHAMQTFLA